VGDLGRPLRDRHEPRVGEHVERARRRPVAVEIELRERGAPAHQAALVV